MPKRLRKLQITRIDLVPAGANQDAHIRLYKAAEPVLPPAPVTKEEYDSEAVPLTTEQILQRNQLWAQWHPLWDAFTSSVWEVMSCGDGAAQHAPVLMQSIQQFATKAQTILSDLGLLEKAAPCFVVFTDVQKAGRVMSGRRMQRLKEAMLTLQGILDDALTSSSPPKATPATKGAAPMADPTTVDATAHAAVLKERDEAVARATAAETALAAAQSQVTTLEVDLAKQRLTPEEQEAAYLATLPESVRKEREADKVEKAELREALRVEKAQRQRQEYIAKTATYAHVGMVPDDHWELVQALETLLPESLSTECFRLLKAAGEQLKASKLLRPVGSTTQEPSGDVADQVLALAQELVDTSKAATIGDGISLVFKQHPDWQRAWNTERRQQTRLKD